MSTVDDLTAFTSLVLADQGLAVIALARPDGTAHASVANVGVLDHPVTGTPVAAMVVRGSARKLTLLREHPRATFVLRSGWRWAAVEGPVELIGPHDPQPGIDADRLRRLLREIFSAAGGTHDDWETYDRVMADDGRTAALLTPHRLYTN